MPALARKDSSHSTPRKQKQSHEKKSKRAVPGQDVSKSNEKKFNKSKKENRPVAAKSQKYKGRETRKLKNTVASKNQQRQKPKPIKISEADQLKFFPNLYRRVVLNLTEESDSEPEETEPIVQDVGKKNEFFGLELEAFLREARNSSQPSKSQNLPKV